MGHNQHKIDLVTAADAESFGALAIGPSHRLTRSELAASLEIIRSFLDVLKRAGVSARPVKVGKSSLQLRIKGKQQTLVIQD